MSFVTFTVYVFLEKYAMELFMHMQSIMCQNFLFHFFQDTCYDPEDGKTSQLKLNLLTTNRRELSPDAWLQFDEKNQEFVGIPLEEEVGREEYQLVCSDAKGLSAIGTIHELRNHIKCCLGC